VDGVEGALEARFVVGEAGEGVEAGGVAPEGAGKKLIGVQIGFVVRGNSVFVAMEAGVRRSMTGPERVVFCWQARASRGCASRD
jgi:hypothetical protein